MNPKWLVMIDEASYDNFVLLLKCFLFSRGATILG